MTSQNILTFQNCTQFASRMHTYSSCSKYKHTIKNDSQIPKLKPNLDFKTTPRKHKNVNFTLKL